MNLDKIIVCDTEYHKETKELFWVGVSYNGHDIYGMPWEPQYVGVISELMEDESLTKVFHNAIADIRVLRQAGVEVKGPVWDTMLAMYVLHPGLAIGLSHAARFYLDDVKQWKEMAHDDPEYNALVQFLKGLLYSLE